MVLGPAHDGGYYLIGLKRPCPSLFHDIQWGTHDVLARTLEVVRLNGLSVKLVELMDDVDRPEDLEAWDRFQKVSPHGLQRLSHSFDSERHAATPAIISVIIPTLNEAHILPATLETVSESENVEVIIADGGSNDETMEIARAYNVRSLQVPACRAAQMNAGAKEACGDILLFLHADTRAAQEVGKSCSQRAGQAERGRWRVSAETRRKCPLVANNRGVGQYSIAQATHALWRPGHFHKSTPLPWDGRVCGTADNGGFRVHAPPEQTGPHKHCTGACSDISASLARIWGMVDYCSQSGCDYRVFFGHLTPLIGPTLSFQIAQS